MSPRAGERGRLLLTVAVVLTLPPRPAGSWGARIIGGHEVMPHSRPYMVSVQFEGQHHCGGFLLRARWVVSAAHCFSHRDPRTGLVVLGAHVLRAPEPTQQVFGISAVIRHPDYQPDIHANDICLLLLNGSAVLGPAVGLLKLPRRDARPLKAGAQCQVAGWGSVSDFEDLPPGLMEAEVRVLSLDVCNSSWRGQLSPAMLCTQSGDRRRRGFCSADSGGPLVCRNRAHGLVSFSGLWCGDHKTPDVYTQVSAFVSWIWDVVRRPRPSPLPRTTGSLRSHQNHNSTGDRDGMANDSDSSFPRNPMAWQVIHRPPQAPGKPGGYGVGVGQETASVPNPNDQIKR
ncbi:serine protease 57 [Mustela nigripes]|uniref:serine protease 57 n=1 Tax=Mustela nigripes TaxID=77151 RepID=UPI00281637F6|nr:serine protease 57 [Mustela nigripes]